MRAEKEKETRIFVGLGKYLFRVDLPLEGCKRYPGDRLNASSHRPPQGDRLIMRGTGKERVEKKDIAASYTIATD